MPCPHCPPKPSCGLHPHSSRKPSRTVPTPGLWLVACHLCSSHAPCQVFDLCQTEKHIFHLLGPPRRAHTRHWHSQRWLSSALPLSASGDLTCPAGPERDLSSQGRVPFRTPKPQIAGPEQSAPAPTAPICIMSGPGHMGKPSCCPTPHTCSASSRAPFPQVLLSRGLQTWDLITVKWPG